LWLGFLVVVRLRFPGFVEGSVIPSKVPADTKAARETYEHGVTETVEKTEAESVLSNTKTFVNLVKEFFEKR